MFKFRGNLTDLCLLVLLVCSTVSVNPLHSDHFDDEDELLGNGSGDGETVNFEINADKVNNVRQHLEGLDVFYAYYNESCGPHEKFCSPLFNLVCSKEHDRCTCEAEFTYVNESSLCWPIPKSSNDICFHDAQCHAGKWGEYSKCSKENTICQCFDYKSNGKEETVLVDGICYIQKYIGDPCQTTEECDKTIRGNAYCHVSNYTDEKWKGVIGSCQCRTTHFWYNPLGECMKKSTKLNDSCVITSQCREGALGKYSICNNETARCECYGGPHESRGVIYHRELKKCFPRRAYKDPCEDDDACRASLGPKAKCGRLDGHPHKIVCYNDSDKGHSSALIALVAICILLVIGIILVGLFLLRRRRIRRRAKQKGAKKKLSTSAGESLLPAQTYWTAFSNLSIRIYPAEEVTMLTQIGQGYFATVFKGKLNDQIIAVKQVRDEHSTAVIREIETMANFSHINILPLLGVAKVSDTESPWLLFEFMEHGDLANVLRNEKFKQSSSTIPQDSDVMTQMEILKPQFRLTDDKLLNMALQIAEGMKYLAFHRFVHRDLAARNCLVGSTGVIKISDFGLSRDVYSGDYYRARGNKHLPIRWMSPESIVYGRFTVESDIWAYGIVLWEIYSLGKQPHYGYSNDEALKRITDGVLLDPPEDSPPFIQEIMTGCWKKEPSDRLKFQEICEKFATLKSASEEDVTSSEYEIPRNANHPEYFQMEL